MSLVHATKSIKVLAAEAFFNKATKIWQQLNITCHNATNHQGLWPPHPPKLTQLPYSPPLWNSGTENSNEVQPTVESFPVRSRYMKGRLTELILIQPCLRGTTYGKAVISLSVLELWVFFLGIGVWKRQIWIGSVVLEMMQVAVATSRVSVRINNCFLSVTASFDFLLKKGIKQSPFKKAAHL